MDCTTLGIPEKKESTARKREGEFKGILNALRKRRESQPEHLESAC